MNKYIVPAICAVAGVGIGFAGGFIFAKNKYKKKYEKEAEEAMLKFFRKNKVPEGTKPTKEEAEEIAKDFPKELWTEQFKKDQEKRKEAANIIRERKYDDPDIYDPADYEHPEEDEARYSRCKEDFNEKLDLYSEYSGISKSELLQGGVGIIDAEDFYESDHDPDALEELQWCPDYNELRDINGDILAPEITLGPDFADILQYAENMPASDVWLHDERLDTYYKLSLESPRHIKD